MWWGRFTPEIFLLKREKKSTYLRLETSGPHRELLEDRCEDFLSIPRDQHRKPSLAMLIYLLSSPTVLRYIQKLRLHSRWLEMNMGGSSKE